SRARKCAIAARLARAAGGRRASCLTAARTDETRRSATARAATATPAPTTGAADAVSAFAERLTGHVDPSRTGTRFRFTYGRTGAYGLATPWTPAASATTSAQTEVDGLASATTYHYRIATTSATGTRYGEDQTFTTGAPAQSPAAVSTVTPVAVTPPQPSTPAPAQSPPAPSTGAASDVTATSADLGGSVVADGAASDPAPNGIAGNWSTIFDDEFGGSALDTSNWSTGWFGSGLTDGANTLEQDCYSPSEVSVSGGALTLSAIADSQTCGGVTQPYTSGMITTDGKFQFTYGAFEARVWTPGSGSTIADWPAFWADGQNWPTDGEVDVLEGMQGKACYHFIYPGNNPGGCTTVAGAAAGWHTYAADWEPGSITYYYDGTRVWQQSTGVTSSPMYLILNLALSTGISAPDVAPAQMKVDYVRVWQHAA
ncbi:MAG: family 16 glycosylhydrolase, partial [Solirubrobacteraceae bacterium]